MIPSLIYDLIARIPLFKDATDIRVEALQDVISLNNANFRVHVSGFEYVLRVAAETVGFLGVNRAEEREAATAAARAGVGPVVLYFDSEGNMVTPFIQGREWKAEDFHREANMARLAETLRRLHSVTGVRAECSVYRRIERLLQSAKSLPVELPAPLDGYLDRLQQIEERRHAEAQFPFGLCHNDFWSNNFLDDGEQLWLLDWEFAGNGDGLYDLASISIPGQYSEAEQVTLLQAYGYTRPEDLQSLQTMKWVVAFFEAAWGLVQHGLRGSSDYDYWGYSCNRFEFMDKPF